MDALYGTQRGAIQKGSKVFDALAGPDKNYTYTGEPVVDEPIGGSGATAYSGNLGHVPVRAGTVKFFDGTQIVTDDGNGNLTGNCTAATHTVNYSTGAYVFTFNSSTTAAVTVSYEQNLEANADIPEMDLVLTSAPITARPHKLRARWSIEAQQDFQAYHGVNADVELVAFMANEIAKEINYTIVQHLKSVANAGAVTWYKTPPEGVPYIWHKETFYDALVLNSNMIFSKTQRRNATWVVCGVSVCNVVETMAKFKPAGNTSKNSAGIRKIGTLGEFDVYKDPTMARDSWVMGFKGSGFLDTGYIYAPYQGLYTSQTIVLDDMIARKAMAQRVGLKVVNANFYANGAIDETTVPTADVVTVNGVPAGS
jgi:hypothetical protein